MKIGKKVALAAVFGALGVLSQPAWAAAEDTGSEQGTKATEQTLIPAPLTYYDAFVADREARIAYSRALSDQRRAIHDARVAAMRAGADQFENWAEATSYWVDPWGANLEASGELNYRLMDPYGAAVLDALKADFERRSAAFGFGPVAVHDRHDAIEDWARRQQAALYDASRRNYEAWLSYLPRVEVTPLVVTPYLPAVPSAAESTPEKIEK